MSSAFRRGGSGRKSGSRSNVTATLVPPTGGNTLSSNINEKNLGTSTAMTAAVAGIVDKGEETTIHSLDDGQDKPSSTSTHTSTSKNSNRRHSHSSNRLLLSAEKGIKAWAGGIHLTSTGLNDLDSILGGGQPLGTSILIRQDRWTADLASSLVKYWCAEAISQDQQLIIPILLDKELEKYNKLDDDDDDDDWNDETILNNLSIVDRINVKQEIDYLLQTLPRNLHWDKQKPNRHKGKEVQQATKGTQERQQEQLQDSTTELGILEEIGEEEEEGIDDNNNNDGAEDFGSSDADKRERERAEEGLQNAWQYRKSVQEERSGIVGGKSGDNDSKNNHNNTANTITQQHYKSLGNIFCHSYDLSGRMIEQMVDMEEEEASSIMAETTHKKSKYKIMNEIFQRQQQKYYLRIPVKQNKTASVSSSSIQRLGFQLFQVIVKALNERYSPMKGSTSASASTGNEDNDNSSTENVGSTKPIRLLFYHYNRDSRILAIALPMILVYIRQYAIPVVVMVVTGHYSATTMTTTTRSVANHDDHDDNVNRDHQNAWIQLSRNCDAVLITEGFASRKEYPPPSEFANLHGIVSISKVSTVTAATANNGGGHFGNVTSRKHPSAYIYGLKRDRRKLHIPLLHIPPEEFFSFGAGSVGSGLRSSGGAGAGAPAPGGGSGAVSSSQHQQQPKRRNPVQLGCASNLSGNSILDF